jgi:hypothetical protein
MEGRNVDPRGAATQQAHDSKGINRTKGSRQFSHTLPKKKHFDTLTELSGGKRTLVSKLKNEMTKKRSTTFLTAGRGKRKEKKKKHTKWGYTAQCRRNRRRKNPIIKSSKAQSNSPRTQLSGFCGRKSCKLDKIGLPDFSALRKALLIHPP